MIIIVENILSIFFLFFLQLEMKDNPQLTEQTIGKFLSMQHVVNSCKGQGRGGECLTSHLPYLAFPDPAPFFLAFSLKSSLIVKF